MVVAGLVPVALGMGIAAWRSMRWTLDGRRELGLACVAVAALGGFTLALLLAGVTALVVPLAAALAGFALAFPRGDGGADADDDEPPWWPSFEDELRRYERRAPVTPRRG